MTTRQQYLDAAQTADAAGDEDAARRLVELAMKAEQPPAEFVVPPVERPRLPPVVFEDPTDVQAELRARAAQEAEETAGSRVAPKGGTTLDVQTDEETRRLAAMKRERARIPVAGGGVEDNVPSIFPMFRPTRITTTPDGRMYRDPETGELRAPSLGEEATEAFARQQVLTEPEARERSEQIRRELALEEGDLIETEGPMLSGILSEADPEAGPGVTETALGATLRGTMNWLVAAGGEAYFRGLGYEVDEDGIPVDEDDWGLAIAKVREKMGVPETVDVSYLSTALRWGAAAVGAGLEAVGAEETATTIENAALSIPHLIVPLPGVATSPELAGSATFDPRARRKLLERDDSFDGVVRRIAQNVASGRGFGDEFLESPALREAYANAYGSEEAAFWGGSVFDVLTPAGPGVLMKGAKMAKTANTARKGRAAADAILETGELMAPLTRGEKATDAVLRVARKLEDAATQRKLAKANGAMEDGVVTFGGLVSDLTATLVRNRVTDSQVMNRIGLRAVRTLFEPSIDQAKAVEAASAALRGKGVPIFKTADEVAEFLTSALVKGGVGSDKAVDAALLKQQLKRIVSRQIPEDLVMVSDNVAAPRAIAEQIKKQINAVSRELFYRSPDEVAESLRRHVQAARNAGKPRAASRLEALAAQADKGRIPSGKQIENALAEYGAGPERVSNILNRTVGEVVETMKPLMRDLEVDPNLAPSSLDQLARSNPDLLRRLLSRIKDEAALTLTKNNIRLSRDLTRQQVKIDRLGRGWFPLVLDNSALWRRFSALSGAGDVASLEPVMVNRLRKQLQAAGVASASQVRRQLLEAVERYGGDMERALDNILANVLVPRADLSKYNKFDDAAKRAFVESRRKGAEEGWRRVCDEAYGAEQGPKAFAFLQDLTRQTDVVDVMSTPDLSTFRSLDRAWGNTSRSLGGTGWGGLMAPDYEKVFLKIIFDEGVKKDLARKGLEDLATAYGDVAADGSDVQRWLSEVGTVPLRGVIGVSEESTGVGVARLEVPGANIPRSPANDARYLHIDTAASDAEAILAQSADSWVQFAEAIAPRQRTALMAAVWSALDRTALVTRNIASSMRYGYGPLPNPMGLLGRFIALPAVALGTTSAARVAQTLRQAKVGTAIVESSTVLAAAVRKVTKRRATGTGIQAANGVYYTPRMINDLAEYHGLGMTAVDSERIGSLADDLIREAQSATRRRVASGEPVVPPGSTTKPLPFPMSRAEAVGREALNVVRPDTRGYWMRLAQNVEISFRQSLFEIELAAGTNPQDAARIAREAFLDYGNLAQAAQTDSALGNLLALTSRFHAEGAQQFLGLQALIKGLAENPGAYSKLVRVQMAKAKAQDPYGVHGDRALKTLGMITPEDDGESFYGPTVPLFQPIEGAIIGIRTAEGSVQRAKMAWDEIEARGGGPAQFFDVMGNPVAPEALEAIRRNLSDVTRFSEDLQKGVLTPQQRALGWQGDRLEALYYIALAQAALSDPPGGDTENGTWETRRTILQPDFVEPPPEVAFIDPFTEQPTSYWTKVPEGLPSLYMGDVRGAPRYLVVKPSEAGLKNVKLAMALTPEAVQRLTLAYVGFRAEGGSLDPGEAAPTGWEALGSFALYPAGTADPERIQEGQAEQIRAVREDF